VGDTFSGLPFLVVFVKMGRIKKVPRLSRIDEKKD
jgi:hypothetical protein